MFRYQYGELLFQKMLFVQLVEHCSKNLGKTKNNFIMAIFINWYFRFIRDYLSIWQVVFMAVLFNVLKVWVPQQNLLLFWVLPSLLSTLQLFYFGTYLPHKGEHDNRHHSRTQNKNHVVAFFTCYFFGYHYEHHDAPGTPWWLLWKMKSV